MTNSKSNSNFCKPFRELIKSEGCKTYHVRLGPKIYIVQAEQKIGEFYRWGQIQVLDPNSDQPRWITDEELAITWLKPNLKAVVNYQKASEPNMKLVMMKQEAKRKGKERYAANWK